MHFPECARVSMPTSLRPFLRPACLQAVRSAARKAVTEAKIRVAINGFGRIGRNFIRCWHGRKDSPLEVVVINDTGGVKQVGVTPKFIA